MTAVDVVFVDGLLLVRLVVWTWAVVTGAGGKKYLEVKVLSDWQKGI